MGREGLKGSSLFSELVDLTVGACIWERGFSWNCGLFMLEELARTGWPEGSGILQQQKFLQEWKKKH